MKLLHFHGVEYLLVGGYAVALHGYPRSTGDMNIWIDVNTDNAEKATKALKDFGIPQDEVTKELFLEKDKVVRMGFPPVIKESFNYSEKKMHVVQQSN